MSVTADRSHPSVGLPVWWCTTCNAGDGADNRATGRCPVCGGAERAGWVVFDEPQGAADEQH